MSVKITVNNIGPLRKAEAELKPLTLLVGPNNSGKSTLATLVYAAMSAQSSGESQLSIPALARSGATAALPRDRQEAVLLVDELRAVLSQRDHEFGTPGPTRLPERLREYLERHVRATLRSYGDGVRSLAEHAFGSDFPALARMRRDGRRMPAKLTIEHANPRWRVEIRPRDTIVSPPTDIDALVERHAGPRAADPGWLLDSFPEDPLQGDRGALWCAAGEADLTARGPAVGHGAAGEGDVSGSGWSTARSPAPGAGRGDRAVVCGC